MVLCAHPSRSGIASGEGDGASTAWSNSVRSRLFFTRPADDPEGDGPADPNARILSRKKANYAARGDEIRLTWRNGVFVADGASPAGGIIASIEKRNAETAFLEALDQATGAGVNVSNSRNAGNFAPKVLRQMPAGRGFKPKELETAMYRLLGDLRIQVVPYGPPSNNTKRIERVSTDG